MPIYAVVKTGGKQYRVAPGDLLKVEKLETSPGDTLELTDVLMVSGDDGVKLGSPLLDGAKVVVEVEAQGRRDKIRVLKFKNKNRYRKLTGHRQPYTALRIKEIQTG
jgi:large subunit ribosomal protein L21